MNRGKEKTPEISTDIFPLFACNSSHKVSQDIFAAFFDDKKSIFELDLNFKIARQESNHVESQIYEFSLIDEGIRPPRVIADCVIEEMSFTDNDRRKKLLTLSVSKINGVGAIKPSSPIRLLALLIGGFFFQRIRSQLELIPSNFILDITLIREMPFSESNINSFWDIESSIERFLDPYSRGTSSSRLRFTSSK